MSRFTLSNGKVIDYSYKPGVTHLIECRMRTSGEIGWWGGYHSRAEAEIEIAMDRILAKQSDIRIVEAEEES